MIMLQLQFFFLFSLPRYRKESILQDVWMMLILVRIDGDNMQIALLHRTLPVCQNMPSEVFNHVSCLRAGACLSLCVCMFVPN